LNWPSEAALRVRKSGFFLRTNFETQ